jgi:hypothetical protein
MIGKYDMSEGEMDGFRTMFFIGSAIVLAPAIYAYFLLNIKELDFDKKVEIMME